MRHSFRSFSSVSVGMVLVFAGVIAPANAATRWVSNSGVDSASCGSQSSPCRSISQGMANASAGDTIYVGPGHYGDVNGDGNFTGPGDEHPDPFGAGLVNFIIPSGCVVCITKPLHIYSLDGAVTTVISSDPHAPFGSVVLIETSLGGVDFGSAGQGFTVTRGNGAGITISVSEGGATQNISVEGNIDLGDSNGFVFSGYPYLPLGCPPGDCELAARVLFEGNQAINTTVGFDISAGFEVGPGQIIIKDNQTLAAATGFLVTLGSGPSGGPIPPANVQLINNVAASGGIGFSAQGAGPTNDNIALNNTGAGFRLVPNGASFDNNTAIGNGGPGVIVDFTDEFGLLSQATFIPFSDNNFIGNDRQGAHCGVQNLGAPNLQGQQPPPALQLVAANNYWGSADGPSATGPGDAAGGHCEQTNATTIAAPFASKPFAVRTNL